MFPSLEVDIDSELVRYKEYAEKIRPMVRDTVSYLHKAIAEGRRVLVEGANAAMLDIDFGKFFFKFYWQFVSQITSSLVNPSC